jgi:hypothetical protein
VTAGLQAASSLYYGVMTAIALVVTFVGVAAGVGRMRNGRLLGRAALAAIVALIVLAPVVWPYWRMQQDEGFARNLYEASRHEAVLTSYLQVPPTNVIYGSTHVLTERDSAGALREGRHEGVEDELFPGALLMLLAALGLVASRREATAPVAWTMLALAGSGSCCRSARTASGQFTRSSIAWSSASRRCAHRHDSPVLVMFGLAVLASCGATALTERTGRPVVGAALLLILCLEYASIPMATGGEAAVADGRGAVAGIGERPWRGRVSPGGQRSPRHGPDGRLAAVLASPWSTARRANARPSIRRSWTR